MLSPNMFYFKIKLWGRGDFYIDSKETSVFGCGLRVGVALIYHRNQFHWFHKYNISSVKRQLSYQVLLTPDYLRNHSQDEGHILILPYLAKYAKFPLPSFLRWGLFFYLLLQHQEATGIVFNSLLLSLLLWYCYHSYRVNGYLYQQCGLLF